VTIIAVALYRPPTERKRLEMRPPGRQNSFMTSLRGIARLLRLPLVATAVSNVTAGYLVALLVAGDLRDFNPTVLVLLAGTSAGLYLFGMVENDLADVRRDRFLGVRRPLVTGEVGWPMAVALLVLTALAAGVCVWHLRAVCEPRLGGPAVLLAVGTFAVINLYNLAAKRGPAYVAITVMGLCRILNYGIGVAAAVGIPRHRIDLGLLLPTGPLWVRHSLALFFATAVITGYSIAARRRLGVSSRPWQIFAVFSLLGGLGMWFIAHTVHGPGFVPPLARVFAAVALASLWPGRLWSGAGPQRTPDEYAPFIERALYWLILLDAAFVVDALLWRAQSGA